MSYHGAHNWPPVWISLYDKDDTLRRSEVGVLTEARASQFGLEDRIVLVMKHDEKDVRSRPYVRRCDVLQTSPRANERLRRFEHSRYRRLGYKLHPLISASSQY